MNHIQRICEKILKDISNLEVSSREYQSKYIHLYQVLRDLYPEEVQQLFLELGFQKQIDLWKEKGMELINQVDSYGINFETKEIQVSLGEDQVNCPLINISNYISKELSLNTTSWQYHVVFSYLIQADIYEKFQLVHTVILNKSY